VHRLEPAIDTGLSQRAGTAPDPGFTAGRFALLFGLLIFAAFPQVMLGLQTFVVRDFGFFAYPLAYYQRECFWRGELPLWNPYSHCGLPFLAQWNTMPLYPPVLIYLLLPLNWSLSFFCLVHLFWAGLGMYLLARRWTGSLLAGSVAGLIFGFNGFSLNLLMWPSHIATLSWMPWVVLAVERALIEGGRKIILAALVGTLQMLAGGPETIFFTWLICLAVWLARFAAGWCENAMSAVRNGLWQFPLVALLVAALSAAQLLPFLDLAAHSQRAAGFADARWSMPKWGWLNLLVPMLFGTIGKQGLFFQNGQGWTSSYYLGIGAVLLTLAALLSVRKPRVWLLAGAALLGLILATGDQTTLSSWARRLLPQLSLMTYPIKFVTVTVFAVPLLAGFGIDWLQTQGPDAGTQKRLLWLAAGLVAVIAGALIFDGRFPQPGENPSGTMRNGLSRAVFLLGAVVLIWTLIRGAQRPVFSRLSTGPHVVPLLLLVLFWLDVWTHLPQQNPAVPPWVYAPEMAAKKLELDPKPALGESRLMVAPAAQRKFLSFVLEEPKDNYLVKRLGFFADCNLLDSVPKVDGFFSLCPRECGELNSAIYVSGIRFGAGLADFLSVSHLTAPGDYANWTRRGTWLPLVTAGQQPVFLDDTNALLTLLSPGFDPRKTVLLPVEAKSLVSLTNQANAQVSLKRFAPQQIEAQVEADSPVMVVIGQTYYHRWRAYLDGQPANLLRANYAFQAVPTPAGRHQVELRYQDRAFHAGALVSGFTLFACLMAWLFPATRRQRQQSDRPPIWL